MDDDLAERLKQAAARDSKSFKDAVNDTLRAGLGLRDKPTRKTGSFEVRTYRSHLKAGIDETKLNQFVDQLEVESFLAETLQPGRHA